MIEVKAGDRDILVPLFAGWEETLIWSCLQGCMGRAWADKLPQPTAAQIAVGDFLFFAGDALSPGAREAARHIPAALSGRDLLLTPQNHDWQRLLTQTWGGRARPITRYAIQKEPGVFNRKLLESYVKKLPVDYTLLPVDKSLYAQCLQESWSTDLVSQFDSAEDYGTRGLGVVAVRDGKLAAGASSYTIYREGIEIEVDTHPDHRRRGLATACAAALILRCLDRGLYPSWDAANLWSVALAEKLGYHFSHEYPCFLLKQP